MKDICISVRDAPIPYNLKSNNLLTQMDAIFLKFKTLERKRKEFMITAESFLEKAKDLEGYQEGLFYIDSKNENNFCLLIHWKNDDELKNLINSNCFRALLGTRTLLESDVQILSVTESFIH